MPHKKHHHHHKREHSGEHHHMPSELKRSQKFYGNPMTTFAEKKPSQDQHNQDIVVNVTVNEKQEDCMTGCFKTCFGIGKAAAK